ncbi:leukotriene A-4 hydrolase [Terfezia claveryi]|nr:leukotriene A-4 hydrolase [Terfezia claveryi]
MFVPSKTNIRSPDPNTLANVLDFAVLKTTLDYELLFEKRAIEGVVEHEMECTAEEEGAVTEEIWLDSSYVVVEELSVNGEVLGQLGEKKEGEDKAEVETAVTTEKGWRLEERVKPYGSKLRIVLGRKVEVGEKVGIKIKFRTTEECTALGWMDPEQTSNKQHPYMYSQCQAIHCRSLFPCQDTPFIKSTYHSTIRSPLPVVVSGLSLSTQSLGDGRMEYSFQQKIPIPSYLYAIASGDITSAKIGPRSSLWTGPDELEACQKELDGDTERFIAIAERIVYPYPWETYNVLILPPSFPYGGMENPNMTFATPTIISGDKSNIDVIAHELAHSWSGNLVTNASWQDFWLNEGWTTYLERRIQGSLHGEAKFHFSAIIGWKALRESVDQFGSDHEFTKLIVDLEGKDPDDAFSSVPYEKGFNFLFYLDNLVGREKWDKFIPHYFSKYRQKSLTSQDFRETLLDFFLPDPDAAKALEAVDWEKWYHSPGLPTPKPSFDTTLAEPCYALAQKWETLIPLPFHPSSPDSDSRFTPSPQDIAGWSSEQLVVFLEKLTDLPTPLTPPLTQLMDATYSLSVTDNAEVKSRFFTVGLKAQDRELYDQVAFWLGKVGRMKFVRPLYRLLAGVNRTLAVRTFVKNRSFYHPICRDIVRKDLGLEEIL